MRPVIKALRRSIKGEKENKQPHFTIAPKSDIAVLPPKKVSLSPSRNRSGAIRPTPTLHIDNGISTRLSARSTIMKQEVRKS